MTFAIKKIFADILRPFHIFGGAGCFPCHSGRAERGRGNTQAGKPQTEHPAGGNPAHTHPLTDLQSKRQDPWEAEGHHSVRTRVLYSMHTKPLKYLQITFTTTTHTDPVGKLWESDVLPTCVVVFSALRTPWYVTLETAADKIISPQGKFSSCSGAFSSHHMIFISTWRWSRRSRMNFESQVLKPKRRKSAHWRM